MKPPNTFFWTRFYSRFQVQQEGEHKKEVALDGRDERQLLLAFQLAYKRRFEREPYGLFFSHPSVMSRYLSLDAILMHAFYRGGHRALVVMKELDWFDGKGRLSLNNQVLRESLLRVQSVQKEYESVRPGPI
jgi:hypothetical protein